MTADLQAQLAEALLPFVHRACTCQMFDSREKHNVNPPCLTRQVAAEAAEVLAALVSAHVAQARKGLADAWDEGYAFWYDNDVPPEHRDYGKGNPYRPSVRGSCQLHGNVQCAICGRDMEGE